MGQSEMDRSDAVLVERSFHIGAGQDGDLLLALLSTPDHTFALARRGYNMVSNE
jgi:hypothetical protein